VEGVVVVKTLLMVYLPMAVEVGVLLVAVREERVL